MTLEEVQEVKKEVQDMKSLKHKLVVEQEGDVEEKEKGEMVQSNEKVTPIELKKEGSLSPPAKKAKIIEEAKEEGEKAATAGGGGVHVEMGKSAPALEKGSSKSSAAGKELCIVSWNVGGINACLKKGFLDMVKVLKADILILQETKLNASLDYMPKDLYPHQYQSHCTRKKGYSGTAVFSKIKPISVSYKVGEKESDEFDEEGRYIILEFEDFYLLSAYVPNAGQKLERLESKSEHYKTLSSFIGKLEAKKPVIFGGDINVCQHEIDLARPKQNTKTAGFTPLERKDFTNLLEKHNLFDSYRKFHPNVPDIYTYYSFRFQCYEKNLGWRLDNFVVSSKLSDRVKSSDICKDEFDVFCESHTARPSDHVPIKLVLI